MAYLSRTHCGALFFCIIALLTLLFFYAFRERAKSSLLVDENALNLGQIFSTDRMNFVVPLSNIGSRPINITGFDRSCSCTEIFPKSLVIGPGKTTDLVLSFDFQRVIGNTTNEINIPIESRIRPRTTEHEFPPFTVRGVLVRRVLFKPREFDFGVCRADQSVREACVSMEVLVPHDHVLVNASEHVKAHIENGSQPNLHNITLVFDPSKCVEGIEYLENVTAVVSFQNGEIASTKLPVRATVTNDIEISPNPIIFGRVNGKASVELQICSNAARKCKFLDATLTGKAQIASVAVSKASPLSIKCDFQFPNEMGDEEILKGDLQLNFGDTEGHRTTCRVPWVAVCREKMK